MRRLSISAALVVGALGGAVLGSGQAVLAAPGGNSTAAHACQQGGYENVVGLTSTNDVVTFSNTGECVSYAAHGSTLYQVSSSTFVVDPRIPGWQDTGVALGPGSTATITATNNGVTCDRISPPPNCNINTGTPASAGYLAPTLGRYVLVGVVDSGTPFEVGSGTTVSGPGELFLGYNDNVYSDNGGSFTATITTYTPVG
jgi:hypothetical protein